MVMEVQGVLKVGEAESTRSTIRQLSEKILEKDKQIIIACVDLEKAYDRIYRENFGEYW